MSYVVEIISVLFLLAPSGGGAVSADKAKAAFEQIKKLDGDWEGKSTKGWTERIGYRVIANGSCVMELSYGAHPREWMATMIFIDGERLLLTHYCAARNQPRLLLTQASDDLRTITFTFLDGTNLPSRDTGHMDKVVFHFDDPDRFRSRWTWYQNGEEKWMEDIEHRRTAAPTTQPATGNPLCAPSR